MSSPPSTITDLSKCELSWFLISFIFADTESSTYFYDFSHITSLQERNYLLQLVRGFQDSSSFSLDPLLVSCLPGMLGIECKKGICSRNGETWWEEKKDTLKVVECKRKLCLDEVREDNKVYLTYSIDVIMNE